MTDEESKFLIHGYNYQPSNKKQSTDLIVKQNSFYDRGLKTYEFTNKAWNSETTKFNFTYIVDSAESLIASTAQKAKIIGISATANIDSVLCNYSLKYLENKLGSNLHFIEEKDFNKFWDSNNKFWEE